MRKERIPVFLLFLIVVAAMMSLVLCMRWGPGVGGDATIYITSARNLLAGKGLGLVEPDGSFRLLPYFPPFYSLALSLMGILGFDQVTGAYWINLLAFGGLVWMTGQLLLQTGKKAWIAIASALIVGFSPILIPVFSWAMSEPLSIFLGFASLVVLLSYLHGWQKRWLILSAILAGLSFLTRYSSVAFLAAGGLGIAWFARKRRRKERYTDLLIYGILSILPMTIWVAVDLNLTSTVASRSMESGVAERVSNLFPLLKSVFMLWLLPESLIYNPPYPQLINTVVMAGAGLGVVALIALSALMYKKTANVIKMDKRWQMAVLSGLFILSYLVIIALVYITTYPPITIGSRMLSPVHVAVLWLLVLLLGLMGDHWHEKRWLKSAIVGFLFILALWYGARSVRIVAQNYEEGLGYLSRTWQESETVQAVKDLPQDVPLVSNETNAILFLTGKQAYPLKEIYTDEPLQDFIPYGEGDLQQDEGQYAFREQGAALVLFDTIDDQLIGLYEDRTAERIEVLVRGLYRAYRGSDGGIFYYSEP